MTLRDLIISAVRTGVSLLIGWLAALLIGRGVDVDTATTAQLVAGLGNLLALVVYALLRVAETRWPAVGVLLGWKASPVYDDSTVLARVDPAGVYRAGPAAALPTGRAVAPEVTVERLVDPRAYP